MQLVIGLGNPGDQYKNTRHNFGFMVVEKFAKEMQDSGSQWQKEKKFKAEILMTSFNEEQIILVKPQTFMNNSGESVKKLANFYQIEPKNIIVIHDELDLPLGKIKIALGGGAAGHHGIESIIEKMGGSDFFRVRLGIDKNDQLEEENPYVTQPFTELESMVVKDTIDKAVESIKMLLSEGLERAQNEFH